MMKKIFLVSMIVSIGCSASKPTLGERAQHLGSWRYGHADLGAGTADTVQVVGKTPYHEIDGNAQRSFSSTSSQDDNGGSGARKATVVYYDESMDGPHSVTKNLDGTALVSTVSSDISYIERLYTSNGTNVGTITLHETSSGGNAYATIAPGDGQTLTVRHYVATGYECEIDAITASTSGLFTTFILRANDPTVNPEVPGTTIWSQEATGSSPISEEGLSIVVQGPARIIGFAIPSEDNQMLDMAIHFRDSAQ